MSNEGLLQCYNRGCGKKYKLENNAADACRYHPGAPFFHDAYKGWSCCNKKCTDFTEFLNIKGCTVGSHSNIKPPEPEKPKVEIVPDTELIEVKPIVAHVIKRPPFDTPMVNVKPDISPSVKSQINEIDLPLKENNADSTEIAMGTICKNGGCSFAYVDSSSNDTMCLHHPGVPIFHEGLKYWSCCQRKTTDFNAFLSQEGCKEGNHVWKKDTELDSKVQCRWDYHQTGPFIVVSIYAKRYSPTKSVVQLNPIRLYLNLVFPQKNNANFELDIELRGIIDVAASNVTMYGTKVEIKLKKAEAGNWPKLESNIVKKNEMTEKEAHAEILAPKIEAVDLSDL